MFLTYVTEPRLCPVVFLFAPECKLIVNFEWRVVSGLDSLRPFCEMKLSGGQKEAVSQVGIFCDGCGQQTEHCPFACCRSQLLGVLGSRS